jgi:hypothetical protein
MQPTIWEAIWEARTCIAIPNTRPSSGITNHDPDTASSDRPIPSAARWQIAVHVLSASAGARGFDHEITTRADREAGATCGGCARFGMSRESVPSPSGRATLPPGVAPNSGAVAGGMGTVRALYCEWTAMKRLSLRS